MTRALRISGPLRPLRRRHRRRPLPDVDPPPGRGAAVPERGARLLGAEPLGRREAGAARLGDLPLRSRDGARDREGRRRDPAGDPALRGPADPRRPPGAAVPGLHAEADARPRTAGARLLRQGARRARRPGRVRRHRRVRRRDPAAHHRLPVRHPRGRPGRVPQEHRRRDHHRRHPDRVRPVVVRRRAVRARRLRRVAVQEPRRRPHDRAAERRGRRTRRVTASAHPRRGRHLRQHGRRRRQRDRARGSSASRCSCSPSTRTSAGCSSRTRR